ncbi:hypothetical protein HCN44_005695 [Aphidius gifuensis]|uniref:Uncharacterized protein n=1 Tax=Aphidius gifuensis TaxID=684658 RepID=A0A835CRK0_APHGI|nr:hypothetical protein HCN44_005695 [Aphidius gifuensis]
MSINDLKPRYLALIFQQLPYVDRLNVEHVTDVAIQRVLENCPALEVLNVMGTAVTVATIQLADRATRHRFGNASKLHVFIHQNIIKDFECLNTPANKYLVLQHDVFWQNQTRVFN